PRASLLARRQVQPRRRLSLRDVALGKRLRDRAAGTPGRARCARRDAAGCAGDAPRRKDQCRRSLIAHAAGDEPAAEVPSTPVAKARKARTDPVAFINAATPAGRRRDGLVLLELMREVSGLEPQMYGASIVGFGEYAYEYDSGRKGKAPAAAFPPRQAATTIYLLDGIAYHAAELDKRWPP